MVGLGSTGGGGGWFRSRDIKPAPPIPTVTRAQLRREELLGGFKDGFTYLWLREGSEKDQKLDKRINDMSKCSGFYKTGTYMGLISGALSQIVTGVLVTAGAVGAVIGVEVLLRK